MTTFFADVRIHHSASSDPHLISVELPASDMAQAMQVIGAWKAGLAASPKFDRGTEEALTANKRKGTKYLTLREAAVLLRNSVF